MSEGINFADENARAVVVLGIPYPAFKDSKVMLKKQFNSHPRNRQRGLVSGDEWYSLQAFRAMNQVRACFAMPAPPVSASAAMRVCCHAQRSALTADTDDGLKIW